LSIAALLSISAFADEFSFLGPLSPEKINIVKIVDDYNKGIFSNNLWNSNWQLDDGTVISWRNCSFNQQKLSIETNIYSTSSFALGTSCRMKLGSFLIFKTTLINPEKQIVRYICNKQNFRYIFLNGKPVFGDAGELPGGTNELVLVYVKKPGDKNEIPFRIINAFTGKECGIKYKSIIPSKNKKIKIPKITDGKLKFIITDIASGKIKPCRLYVYNKNGQPQYDFTFPSCFETFTCGGEAELNLLPGDYTFTVESGKEFLPVKGKVKIEEGKTVTKKIRLEKIADMNKEGWYAGDMHNHTDIKYTPLYIKSENINIAYVPNWWINPPMGRTSNKDLNNFPPLIKIDDTHFLYTRAGEDERNDCTLMFFGMPDDVEIPEVTWTFPPSVYFAKKFGEISNVKPKSTDSISPDLVAGFGVWVHLDHLYWWQTPQILACGELDSIEVINNNFVHGGVNITEAWGKPRDKKKYPDPYGNAEYQQDVYFKILNCGLRIPPGAGSAAPVGGGPFGYNRVYVKVEGKLTWEKWWNNLKAGKCFVTCGPLLRVTANGKLPGHIFKSKKSIKIDLRVKINSIDKITKVQIIKNGKIYKSFSYDEFNKIKNNCDVSFSKSGWFLVRVLTDNPGTYRFAMTAPVYVEIGDNPKYIDKKSVKFFLEWAEQAAKRNPETDPEKRKLVDEYSKETITIQKKQ